MSLGSSSQPPELIHLPLFVTGSLWFSKWEKSLDGGPISRFYGGL